MTEALTIVTAADEKFGRTLFQFLKSAERARLNARHRFVAYDLGLAATTRDRLARRFAWCEFRHFDFGKYPPHVAMARGTYAFKPLLIADLAESSSGILLWLDSATLFHTQNLDFLARRIERDATYVLTGQSSLGGHCDPKVLRALNVPSELLHRKERVAGVIGLDLRNETVRELVGRWRDHALIEDHIRPDGAELYHHKPEQALLGILLYQYEAAGKLKLTDDAVDISTAGGIRFLSTRNKVSAGMPPWADPLVRLGYAIQKRLDRIYWRWRNWKQTRFHGWQRKRKEHFTVFVAREGQSPVALKAPKGSYYADPFPVERDGKTFLFVEQFHYRDCLGRIAVVELDDKLDPGPPRTILDPGCHASFPFIFEEGGKTYLIPETSSGGSVDLYVCETFPDKWRLARRLLYGIDAADSVLFRHAERWWLITAVSAGGSRRSLAIFSSADFLGGEWRPHPVNAERRYAELAHSSRRNAGPVFEKGGILYRVAQHNPHYYGESLRYFRIDRLSDDEYSETEAPAPAGLHALAASYSPHHICMNQGMAAWDVRDRTGWFTQRRIGNAEPSQ